MYKSRLHACRRGEGTPGMQGRGGVGRRRRGGIRSRRGGGVSGGRGGGVDGEGVGQVLPLDAGQVAVCGGEARGVAQVRQDEHVCVGGGVAEGRGGLRLGGAAAGAVVLGALVQSGAPVDARVCANAVDAVVVGRGRAVVGVSLGNRCVAVDAHGGECLLGGALSVLSWVCRHSSRGSVGESHPHDSGLLVALVQS